MACDICTPLARQVFLSLYAYYIDSQFSKIEKCARYLSYVKQPCKCIQRVRVLYNILRNG